MRRNQKRGMSRRRFLGGLSTALGDALLAACGPARGGNKAGLRAALSPSATPQIILPSPAPAETAAGVPSEEEQLADFLALSALLTGVENLNPELGRIYLASLRTSAELEVSMAQLLESAGLRSDAPATTLAALEATGILAKEQARQLANRIVEMWYTGIYTNPAGEEVVATYVDALAWQTLRFTKPKTICGRPGFWAQGWNPPM